MAQQRTTIEELARVVGPTEAVAVVVQLPADWPGEEGISASLAPHDAQ
jgi:hypothetical protein